VTPDEDELLVMGLSQLGGRGAGSGAMNLNHAVITVRMTAAADGGTLLHIRGAAKEGLIKQHAGEKAARRLEVLLDESLLPRDSAPMVQV
jgi:hypothetical protein